MTSQIVDFMVDRLKDYTASSEILPSSDFVRDLELDSFSALQFIMDIELEFDCSIPVTKFSREEYRVVSNLAGLVAELSSNRPNGEWTQK